MADKIRLEGEVIDSVKGLFKVKVNTSDDYIATCTLSGKIREHCIKIVVGDLVTIEVSEYDTCKGRIVQRLKQ